MAPEITGIETVGFTYELSDVAFNEDGYMVVYEPGSTVEQTLYGVRVRTSEGIAGEYVGSNPAGIAQVGMVAPNLIGKDPFERERHWNTMKRALRKYDRMGMGPIDIALWDFAGKYHDEPVHRLLGTYRTELPVYASTYFMSERGGITTPEGVADFAEDRLDAGIGGFKLHPWEPVGERNVERDAAAVRALGERVGGEMDLMIDPVCGYETFADALRVGRACDEAGFFWYEDPYADGSKSQHAHRKLRESLDTPLLVTEMIRGVEEHADFAAAEATDFVRADPDWDGGITGAMKIARVAEGFGLDCELHLPGPAQRHCMAAVRNSNYYELGLVHPDSPLPHSEAPIYEGGYTDSMDALSEGCVPVPEGPGLGVSYDWDYIEGNAVSRQTFGG